MVRFQCDEKETPDQIHQKCRERMSIEAIHLVMFRPQERVRWWEWDEIIMWIHGIFKIMKNIPRLAILGISWWYDVICQIPKVWYGAMGSYLLTMGLRTWSPRGSYRPAVNSRGGSCRNPQLIEGDFPASHVWPPEGISNFSVFFWCATWEWGIRI